MGGSAAPEGAGLESGTCLINAKIPNCVCVCISEMLLQVAQGKRVWVPVPLHPPDLDLGSSIDKTSPSLLGAPLVIFGCGEVLDQHHLWVAAYLHGKWSRAL